MAELGLSINVFLVTTAANQSFLSNKIKGEYEGVEFKYSTFNKNRDNRVIKIFYWLKGVLITWFRVRGYLKKNPDTKILILSIDPIILLIFTYLARKKNIKVFHERTEFPFINKKSIFSKIKLKFYYKQIRKLDGLFVITNALKIFFKQHIEEQKIVHIPMTVEPERFKIEKSTSKYGKYIAYCGSMYTDKDGVPILLNAFDIFADKFRDVNLVLIGDISNKAKISPIMKVLNALKHKDRVYFTGLVERNDMPTLLVNASALALARPNNIQAQGGFPTKLGEYLATGNPVVVTSVGEIPHYLKHLENAYISQPDSPDDFARKLILLFTDPPQAQKIGLKGKELATGIFNYKTQSSSIFKFIYG